MSFCAMAHASSAVDIVSHAATVEPGALMGTVLGRANEMRCNSSCHTSTSRSNTDKQQKVATLLTFLKFKFGNVLPPT